MNTFPIKTQVKQHMVTLYKKHAKDMSFIGTLLMSNIFIEFCSKVPCGVMSLNG